MQPVIVVGAGISGVACARALQHAGIPVQVLERSHRPGGRLASRRVEGRRVDLGASYFTVSDPRFAELVERWSAAGLAHEWTDTFAVLAAERPAESKSGPMRWGTPGGLRSLVENLAEGLDLTRQQVSVVGLADGPHHGPTVDGRPAGAVVLAMPDPQARRLLGPGHDDLAAALDHDYDPILALTTVWAERGWDLAGGFVNGDDALTWVADDGSRRRDGAPVLVAHSTPELAREHLAAPAEAAPRLVAALRRVLDLEATPLHAAVHRWSFAKPASTSAQPFALSDDLVGVCGDAWGDSAKVEGAYLSGLRLGEHLAARLG